MGERGLQERVSVCSQLRDSFKLDLSYLLTGCINKVDNGWLLLIWGVPNDELNDDIRSP